MREILHLPEGQIGIGSTANVDFYIENLLDEEYYNAWARGESPVQFLQPPRTYCVGVTGNF